MSDIPAGMKCGDCFINDDNNNFTLTCKLFGVPLDYLMTPPWHNLRCDACKKVYPYGAKFIIEAKKKP